MCKDTNCQAHGKSRSWAALKSTFSVSGGNHITILRTRYVYTSYLSGAPEQKSETVRPKACSSPSQAVALTTMLLWFELENLYKGVSRNSPHIRAATAVSMTPIKP